MKNCAEALCLSCGMCCNGVIFADVKFQDHAKARKLSACGLKVHVCRKPVATEAPTSFRLPQPCPAFDGVRCRIYRDRPEYCRQFECQVLRKVQSGEITAKTALRRIATARAAAKRVDRMLSGLEVGSQARSWPLARRFRAVLRRAEQAGPGPEVSEELSHLSGRMHRLNLLLSRWFYPGA